LDTNRLTGIHAVREALEAGRPLDTVMVARGTHGNRIEELVRLGSPVDLSVATEPVENQKVEIVQATLPGDTK